MKRLSSKVSTKQLTTRQNRIDITGAQLCDDVIHRLGSSLGQYAGGIILDINPGNGLFSSRLHSFLKPKCHLLFEPLQKRYLPLLQPLLKAPNSCYRLFDWDKMRCGSAFEYIRDYLMPGIPYTSGMSGASGTSDALQVSIGSIDSVLIVANFSHQKTLMRRHESRSGQSMRSSDEYAYNFAHEARSWSNNFAGRHLRMLMWTDESSKKNLLPRTVGTRAKLSLYLEAHCRLEEVVGSANVADNNDLRRESVLAMQSAERVARKAVEMNISLPPGRYASKIQNVPELSSVSRDWHHELRRLEKAFENEEIPRFVGTPIGPVVHGKKTGRASPNHTPEWKHMRLLQRVLKGQNKDTARTDALLEKQAAIDQLDLAANRDGINEEQRNAIFEDLDAKVAELDSELELLNITDLKKYMYKDDDRRAFAMSPPLLMWDRRSSEPMQIHEDEYLGSTAPVLIDFQVKETNDLPLTTEQSTIFDFLATEMMAGFGRTNLDFLKKAAPGAYEALVPKVPALQDPYAGGRRHLASVRNRTLTPKLVHSLAIAWDKWPFKPPMVDLMGLPHLGDSAPHKVRFI